MGIRDISGLPDDHPAVPAWARRARERARQVDRERREHKERIDNSHSLKRTSPTGEDFVGVCTKCGKTGLHLEAMSEECPMAAIKGTPGLT